MRDNVFLVAITFCAVSFVLFMGCSKQKVDNSGIESSTLQTEAVKALPVKGTDDIPISAKEINPLEVGAVVPDVVLTTITGESLALTTVIADKPTVFIFYRGGW